MTQSTTSITEFRNEIQTEVMSKKEVFNALANNTFKGLDATNIPLALLDGMMRGYTIKDFMVKKIYATPFWNGKLQKQEYALVQSIADVRTIAMKAGQTGKSEPKYTYTNDGNEILSCSVTVWKRSGDDRGYTATVFFKEYEKPAYKTKEGKEIAGMWQTKPHTMIAKVAEMAVLRMAFPEALADAYIEEEFDKEAITKTVVDIDSQVVDQGAKELAIEAIKSHDNLQELQTFYKSLATDLVKDDDVFEAYQDQKEMLAPGFPAKSKVAKVIKK